MAWKWTGGGQQPDSGDWIGFLDKGVKLEGTLELAGTFRIDGQVKGDIRSEQSLIIGEGARVEGTIEGNLIVLAGRFNGVMRAKGRVEIQAKGVATGEIHSPCLVIEAGGIFDGRCHMMSGGAAEETRPVTIPIRAASEA
jgi:cytoskeletal protein CcmA (bactofilin family)